MAAPTSYPSWVFNSTQNATQTVATVAQFNALPSPGVWTTTPFAAGVGGAPFDTLINGTGLLQVIGDRLQQILVENRMGNAVLLSGLNLSDDYIAWRADFVANDSSLTS
jgi:hypothetical protein